MKSVLYLVPALTLSLVACSSSTGRTANPSGTISPLTSVKAPVATSAPAPAPSPAWTASALPTVKAQVLALSDLPVGWLKRTIIPGDESATPQCLKALDSSTRPSTDRAVVAFKQRYDVPSLYESVDYAPQLAEAGFRQVVRSLDACHTMNFTAGGAKLSGQMKALPFPSEGNESKAYQVVWTARGNRQVTVGTDVLVMRAGDEDLTLTYSTVGVPAIRDFRALTRLALNKLNDVDSHV